MLAHDVKFVLLTKEHSIHWLAWDTQVFVPSTWQVQKKGGLQVR